MCDTQLLNRLVSLSFSYVMILLKLHGFFSHKFTVLPSFDSDGLSPLVVPLLHKVVCFICKHFNIVTYCTLGFFVDFSPVCTTVSLV